MTKDLLALAHTALARARHFGASAADALVVDGRSLEVAVRDGAIENLEQSEAIEVGLRVFVGQASAAIATSKIDAAGIDRIAEQAVAMAKAAPPDPYAGIANPNQIAHDWAMPDIAGETLLDAAQLRDMALAAEKSALAVKGVSKSGGAGASSSDRSVALAASNGFSGTYQRTGLSLSATAIAGDGTAMERDYDYSSVIHREDLRSAEDIGSEAGRRVVRRVNPRKVKSQAVPVIYDSRIASSLVGHFLSAIMGSAIARGTSFLREKLGEQVFGENIHIIDDPLRPRGLASKPFDAEGIATKVLPLIEAGVLKSWILDLGSARQLGLQTTGHAARGLAGPPGPSSSNVILSPGSLSLDDMIKSIGTGFYVTELIGHGPNIVTGDYSRGASGFWIENGEVSYPVSEVTLAGKLADMFRNLEPANDLVYRGSINAPSCRLEGMTLGGR
ncbi:TldD/PmbA family protein [Aestuariivirga sp. YIM B02566]|uniref:TldD/PmbA family protein n=1 Tax=Taklimakanibacter albus TaxID=2800327 RepID=A0ACC5RCX8_9HYPH|nr:TldD/PmbA family protein [Aestuariivirga sp. YIM B02566]MBK1870489.1 TldD/PmbA family protein [Aestuariivirga sp. YIM B02566]